MVDAFRFGHRVPLSTALDALRDYLEGHPTAPLVALADQLGVYPRMQPYLRALS